MSNGILRDDFAIKVPGGVTKQRNNDGKAEEEGQRSQDQQARHDQPPCCHRHWVVGDDAERSNHRFAGAGMTIEHHWEGHHADAERDERE